MWKRVANSFVLRAVLSLVLIATFTASSFLAPPTSSAAPPTMLSDNLISCWSLEEVSGTRFDSAGTNDLTDNNTVTQAVGQIGSAAQFTATNSEYLSVADNVSISTGDIDFTLAAWVYLDSLSNAGIIAKWAANTDKEYALYLFNNEYRWVVSADGNNDVTLVSTTAPVTGGWHFLVMYHDAVNNETGMQVDNGTVDTLAHSTGVRDGAAPLRFGVDHMQPGLYLDGRIDEVMLWKRVVTAAERSDLYNAGAGRSCSYINPTATPTPVPPTPTGTPAPTATSTPIPATIGNYVWNDTNQDGKQMAGETGISGVTVNLYDNLDTLISTTTTDVNGNYSFNPSAGTYYVEFVLPVGYVFSPQDASIDDTIDSDPNTTTGKTATLTVGAGETRNDVDAGMYQPPTATYTPTPLPPTATNTPTPGPSSTPSNTPPATATATPPPGADFDQITLSSGNIFTIYRRFTYGELFVGLAVFILVSVFTVRFAFELVTRRLR